MAQTPDEDILPVPQNRQSVERYSLPPGPDSNPRQNVLQGPVDDETPLAAPTNVAPGAPPAIAPPPLRTPETGNPAVAPATIESTSNQAQPRVKQALIRPEAGEDRSAPESSPPPEDPVDALNENQETAGASEDSELPSAEIPADSVPENAANDWILLSFAALLFVLLGALFLWRVRKAKPKQTAVTESDRTSASSAGDVAKTAEHLQSAITIGFEPCSANTTLFNAILGFELTLSNHGSEDLSNIRISGSMVQAEDRGTGDPIAADLSPLQEISTLQTGETGKIIAEFRVPLAGIRPIQFGAQALFIPLVLISIAWTDGSGVPQLQTAAFLVGQEHQPPRSKMTPFRLDLGPRSFARLGHRLVAAD